MRIKIVSAVTLSIILFGVARCQDRYVKPVDEASLDKTFLAFRTKLIAAVEKRDVNFILSILDRNIMNGFGGDDGIREFKNWWKIGTRDTSFWKEFLPVIKNGGKFVRKKGRQTRQFLAPYSFAAFPDDLDSFEHSVVFGSGVNLREKALEDARVVDRLSYNIVTIEDHIAKTANSDEADWFKIKTLGGKSGWVKAKYVRSPIDYRASFEKKRGVWKMTAFLAGD